MNFTPVDNFFALLFKKNYCIIISKKKYKKYFLQKSITKTKNLSQNKLLEGGDSVMAKKKAKKKAVKKVAKKKVAKKKKK